MPATVKLPGTVGFDEDQVERRRQAVAAGRARRIALGLVLTLAGPLLAFAYAWDSARPGQGSFDLNTGGHLSWLPLASVVMAVVASALVIVGTRLAVDRDAAHLSRGWIRGGLVVSILVTVVLGSALALPVKWAHSAHPDAAVQREISAKPPWPAQYCTAAVDPGAFAAWVDNAEVCGSSSPQFTEIIIAGRRPAVSSNDPKKGLIYAPDHDAYPYGACFRRLDAAWWEYSGLIDGTSCPSGFALAAGG